MINKVQTIISNILYPYFNQALVKYLLDTVEEASIILFLWQNERAYIYGKDHRLDCKLYEFEEGGIYPIRQLFPCQDYQQKPGDLNFTLISSKNCCDWDQLKALLKDFHPDPTRYIQMEQGNHYCLQGSIPDDGQSGQEALMDQITQALCMHFAQQAQPITGNNLDEAMINTYVKFFTEESWLIDGEM